MARDKDYFDINQIAFGILETSGKLSILPKAEEKQPVCKDLSITPPPPELTDYLIIDGVLRKDVMEKNGYSEEWIKRGLGINCDKDLKNILLASYDEKGQTFNVHYKKQNSKPKEKRSFFGPLCKATGFSNWYSPPLFS